LTHAFNDWLPFDAISDPSFTILFDPIIEAWAKRWFHTTNVGVLAIKPTGANKVQLSSIAGRAINDCANVSWNDDIAMALACAALDTTTDGNKLTTDDQKLIEAFAGKVLADLGKDLADFLGGSADILPPGEVTPRHPADGLELGFHSRPSFVSPQKTAMFSLFARKDRSVHCGRHSGSSAHSLCPLTWKSNNGRFGFTRHGRRRCCCT
jgi:hypothetical protein